MEQVESQKMRRVEMGRIVTRWLNLRLAAAWERWVVGVEEAGQKAKEGALTSQLVVLSDLVSGMHVCMYACMPVCTYLFFSSLLSIQISR